MAEQQEESLSDDDFMTPTRRRYVEHHINTLIKFDIGVKPTHNLFTCLYSYLDAYVWLKVLQDQLIDSMLQFHVPTTF